MKKYKKYFSGFIILSLSLILIAGCSNGMEIEGNKILVEKRIGEEDKYERLREITDHETVQEAKDILEHIRWENAEVSMASPPNYKFHFEGDNEQTGLIFALWISPNKDKVELILESEDKYVQLSKSKSSTLFEAIAGVQLSDVE
ncbi:hypothetical protein D1B33_17825 [Lysinibacillus yapensis]|uniref:YhfM-like domain-containing protein n=1 Tax=Ureibacillus yapensis TaxID=2304605 RepID=A0A396S2M0_9BACL|nr:hypothetical protein [Lysinibacillus yapensis]RHW31371.1 hypothetical protein D1B33_17825 [Lysinibacillus yapensis]